MPPRPAGPYIGRDRDENGLLARPAVTGNHGGAWRAGALAHPRGRLATRRYVEASDIWSVIQHRRSRPGERAWTWGPARTGSTRPLRSHATSSPSRANTGCSLAVSSSRRGAESISP